MKNNSDLKCSFTWFLINCLLLLFIKFGIISDLLFMFLIYASTISSIIILLQDILQYCLYKITR